jgi:hypothetical protein
MNCQTCRQHLEPFLDDELSVNENVAVLEHVTACAACQNVFNTEKRIWESVREKLTREKCPVDVAARALAAVRADARGPAGSRWWLWLAAPVAAAIALFFLAPVFKGEPEHPAAQPANKVRLAFAAERTHDHAIHGEFLTWAGARYDELVDDLPKGQVLTEAVLKTTEPRARAVASIDEFEKVVKAELGRTFKLPQGFVEGGRLVGGELLKWHEGLVQQVIVEYGDRELALYEISGCQAKKLGSEITQLMASLHTIESDPGRQVSISACKGCDAVLVLRSNRTYLLISRHGRDWDDEWLVDRARKLLD